MAIVDISNHRFLVAADTISVFTQIQDMVSAEATHGEESETRTYVLGDADPYVRGGPDTDEYRLSGLYNIGDTAGQNVLRAARDTDDLVVIRVMPEGVGERGYQQECRVTQYTDAAESGPSGSGNYVQCSFSLRAIGARLYSDPDGVFAGDLL